MVIDWPPHPSHPTDSRRGYVLNLFVEPDYRGRGIARSLMAASDREFVQRKISYVILHSTSKGRSLYEGAGWKSTSEMSKEFELVEDPY